MAYNPLKNRRNINVDPSVLEYMASQDPQLAQAIGQQQQPVVTPPEEGAKDPTSLEMHDQSQIDLENAYANAAIGRGAEQLGRGIARADDSVKGNDYSFLVDQAKSKQASNKERNVLMKEQREADPNSPENKKFQQAMGKIFPDMDVSGMTINDYNKYGGDLQKLAYAEKDKALTRERQAKLDAQTQSNADRAYGLDREKFEAGKSNDVVRREMEAKQMALQERMANSRDANEAARLKLEYDKLEQQKSKLDTSDEKFIKKELQKAEIKDKFAQDKETRKSVQDLNKAIPALEEQKQKIARARQAIKESGFSGTGPLDKFVAPFTPHGQKIQQALNDIGLSKMTTMFQGMSKAIDSDSERRYFESTLPNLSNYENTNLDILDQLERNVDSLIAKSRDRLSKATPEEMTPDVDAGEEASIARQKRIQELRAKQGK